MQIESLQVFCDVVRCRSFSQAAAANHLTQSAASQIVLQLERRLGVQLIDRSTRPLQPTPEGKAYYDGCKLIVDQYLELESSIRAGQQEMVPGVEVAAIYSVGLGDMGKYVERFQANHPQARIHIDYLHPDRVYDKVLDGTADFGLVSFPKKLRELETSPWREEEMVLTCSPRHPLACLDSASPRQIEGEKYIAFTRELVIRRMTDRFLRQQGVDFVVTTEFDNIENIKKAVEVDAGIALLPEPTLRKEVEAGLLVSLPLRGCQFARPLGIIQRRGKKLGSAAQHFMDLIRQPLAVDKPRANGQSTASAPKSESKKRLAI